MKSKLIKRLLSYMGSSRVRFFAATFAALVGTALSLAAPIILGEITTILYAGVKDGLWFYDVSKPASVWAATLKGYPLGKVGAIVGPTGAGKTTLVNLLMRFYEINGGEIRVDGVNSRDISRAELRRHFGMVLQDSWLFEGTIRDNLLYSTEREVSEEEMIGACKSVCAHAFIRTMPGGYDFELSKGAANISQGQRQLLTIARAIIANPEIMILDEATSNVDAHTELVIQEAMAALMKGRTSFVIAHRLSTIRDADVILYMEKATSKRWAATTSS